MPGRLSASPPHARTGRAWDHARRALVTTLLLTTLLPTLSMLARAAPQSPTVLMVLSDQSAPYQEVTTGLKERLRGSSMASARLISTDWRSFAEQSQTNQPAMMIAVGVKAMQTVLTSRPMVPVLCGLVPRRAFDVLRQQGGAREFDPLWTALYLDQPPARQLELVRLILPGRQRLGLLAGLESETQMGELRGLARDRRMTLNIQIVESGDGLAAALQKAADTSDAIWMLPDASISNAGSVRDLLLASYRHKRPVIGFSQGYVRAGALAAVYSTPTQVGSELGTMLLQVSLGPSRVPPPRYPAEFEVALNYNVARSYGLHLDDEQTVLRKLRAQEPAP